MTTRLDSFDSSPLDAFRATALDARNPISAPVIVVCLSRAIRGIEPMSVVFGTVVEGTTAEVVDLIPNGEPTYADFGVWEEDLASWIAASNRVPSAMLYIIPILVNLRFFIENLQTIDKCLFTFRSDISTFGLRASVPRSLVRVLFPDSLTTIPYVTDAFQGFREFAHYSDDVRQAAANFWPSIAGMTHVAYTTYQSAYQCIFSEPGFGTISRQHGDALANEPPLAVDIADRLANRHGPPVPLVTLAQEPRWLRTAARYLDTL